MINTKNTYIQGRQFSPNSSVSIVHCIRKSQSLYDLSYNMVVIWRLVGRELLHIHFACFAVVFLATAKHRRATIIHKLTKSGLIGSCVVEGQRYLADTVAFRPRVPADRDRIPRFVYLGIRPTQVDLTSDGEEGRMLFGKLHLDRAEQGNWVWSFDVDLGSLAGSAGGTA